LPAEEAWRISVSPAEKATVESQIVISWANGRDLRREKRAVVPPAASLPTGECALPGEESLSTVHEVPALIQHFRRAACLEISAVGVGGWAVVTSRGLRRRR